ncbi:MAG: hypothetical protein JWO22_1177 [Frankiales bacterium]|nr:hypothetical protein [Frankiales bacterium]
MSLGPVSRNDETAAFFDGTARGELLLRTCPSGHWSEPEAACCTTCGVTDLSWSASKGTGRVVSWSAVHGRPRDDGSADRRVIAVVELDEGPWWWTALQDVEQPSEGLRVQVAFTVPAEDSETVPYFVPA